MRLRVRISLSFASLAFGLFGPAVSLANTECRYLFTSSSSRAGTTYAIQELTQLYEDIQAAPGPLRVALHEEWTRRVAELTTTEIGELRAALQRPKQKENESKADSLSERQQQRNHLHFLNSMNLKATLDDQFKFKNLVTGFGEENLNQDMKKLYAQSGLQFGESGRFVMVRDRSRSLETIIVDLTNGSSQILIGGGRLSHEGDLFFEQETGTEQVHVIDLRTGEKFKVPGVLVPGKQLVNNRWFLTRHLVSKTNQQTYFMHEFKDGVLKSHQLGTEITMDRDLKHLATVVEGRLLVYDLNTIELIDHPLNKMKLSRLAIGAIDQGAVYFDGIEGFWGFRTFHEDKILSLYDFKIHDVRAQGRVWTMMKGAPLLEILNLGRHQIPKLLKSLKSGQIIAAPAWETPRIFDFADHTVLQYEDHILKERKSDGSLTIEEVKVPDNARKVDDKLVWWTGSQIWSYDPGTSNLTSIKKPGIARPWIKFLDHSILVGSNDGDTGRPKVFEIDMDGEIISKFESDFIRVSENGRFLAVEREGRLQIHEIRAGR